MNLDYDAKPWMKKTLFVAGLYNLAWGTLSVLSPGTFLTFAETAAEPVASRLWQCIGMIVGVYGVGYIIASYAPYRHWPITLVGLLGKTFGPIGFVIAVSNGSLPAHMGWIILANDLIWWIPFTVILWGAVRHYHTLGSAYEMPEDDDPLGEIRANTGELLDDMANRAPQLVLLLRHSGCTFCREVLSDVSRQRRQIEECGTEIVIVHLDRESEVDDKFFRTVRPSGFASIFRPGMSTVPSVRTGSWRFFTTVWAACLGSRTHRRRPAGSRSRCYPRQ